MKVNSTVNENTSSSWGFRHPNDGWHKVEMGEGIDLMKDKEGKVVQDAKGNNLWKFPAKINDEDASDHEADIGLVIAETPFGEKKIGDVIAAIGQKENFEKAFPGDRSFFEQAIMDKVKIKIPGQFCQMRTETSKDGKYSNVVEIATMKFKAVEKGTAAPKDMAKGKTKFGGIEPGIIPDAQVDKADW
jgi:hypothetical protein